MIGKIVQWKDVCKGDLVLVDDRLVEVEAVCVTQKPWGDRTTFPAVDVTFHAEAGRITTERHGDRFTAVTTQEAFDEDKRRREENEPFSLRELRSAMRNDFHLDASNNANYDAVVRRMRAARGRSSG